jgi:hypothetical protein
VPTLFKKKAIVLWQKSKKLNGWWVYSYFFEKQKYNGYSYIYIKKKLHWKNRVSKIQTFVVIAYEEVYRFELWIEVLLQEKEIAQT